MSLRSATREYWAKVCVSLHQPLVHEHDEDDEVVVGYWRLFGLRGPAERVRPILEAEIEDGAIEWSDSTWYEIDPQALDETIRARVLPLTGEGIWYRSGRMFCPAEQQ